MLTITIPAKEWFNEATNEFVQTKETVLHMEHSLISLHKWEKKWKKPFLTNKEKTDEEVIDYFRCMTLDSNIDANVYYSLTADDINKIHEYIDDPMTATTFTERENRRFNREIITSEIIYYWMVSLNIPVEFQKWHLNTLITLIRVCNEMNQPPKKMSQRELINRTAAINAARRKPKK